jgi:glutaminase
MPLKTRGCSLKNLEQIEKTLKDLYSKYLPCLDGHTADYIPELAKVDINQFAIVIVTVDGQIFKIGDSNKKFTLQSVSKPFVYGLALETHGRELMLSKVGVEPTGDAFNSIIELEKKSHRPYNPMINSGAIAVSSLINGKNLTNRLQHILDLFENYVGHPLSVDENVFLSEKKTAHRNRAIANLLKHFNIIEGDIEESLDLYFKQCSILVDTLDLALIAATLGNGGVQPVTGTKVLESDSARDILSLMFTCGMYDSAGEWAYSVGLPAKSGVSGGLLAVVPGKMGIAVYSPLINDRGHSVRAMKVFKDLAQVYDLSVFSSGVRDGEDK